MFIQNGLPENKCKDRDENIHFKKADQPVIFPVCTLRKMMQQPVAVILPPARIIEGFKIKITLLRNNLAVEFGSGRQSDLPKKFLLERSGGKQ